MTRQPNNDLDTRIESALAAYTPAAPRIGLEDRILARLAAEGQSRSVLSSYWLWAPVAALTAALAVLAIHQHRAPSVPSPRLAAVHDASLPPSVTGNTAKTLAPHRPAAPGMAKRAIRPSRPTSQIERVALLEMHAASHPDPPQPLTLQEKLLLRLVRRGDPNATAMLDPRIRERQEAQSEAEFHRFVEQSIEGESN
jgi:hypothetical protein